MAVVRPRIRQRSRRGGPGPTRGQPTTSAPSAKTRFRRRPVRSTMILASRRRATSVPAGPSRRPRARSDRESSDRNSVGNSNGGVGASGLGTNPESPPIEAPGTWRGNRRPGRKRAWCGVSGTRTRVRRVIQVRRTYGADLAPYCWRTTIWSVGEAHISPRQHMGPRRRRGGRDGTRRRGSAGVRCAPFPEGGSRRFVPDRAAEPARRSRSGRGVSRARPAPLQRCGDTDRRRRHGSGGVRCALRGFPRPRGG